MSQRMDVVVALPVIAVAAAGAGAVALAGFAAKATADAARVTFSNENLLAVARDLFPDVKVEGPVMTVRAPDGTGVKFSPFGDRLRVGPAAGAGAENARRMSGRIVQAYASRLIESKAADLKMQVSGREIGADGTVRLRVRAREAPGAGAPTITAEVTAGGGVRLEASGIRGPSCRETLEPFVRILGEPRTRENTPDYFLSADDPDWERERERS